VVGLATTFDGYPMAQQGRAAEAFDRGVHLFLHGSLVAVLLIPSAPLISFFALKFGRRSFSSVYLLTFCSFFGLGGSPSTRPSFDVARLLLGVSAWIRFPASCA